MTSHSTKQSGKAAEDYVVRHLEVNGYTILERNITFGSIGEIDIIAEKEGVLCFVEVRSKQSDLLGHPAETVGFRKQKQLIRLAEIYLDKTGSDLPARFDVAAVIGDERGVSSFDYIENAFDCTT